MPEPTQYSLTHQELLALIIKSANIHEGQWMLSVNFNFTAANIGSGPDDALPSALVQVSHIAIQKAKPDTPPALMMDAAEVNPAPKVASKKKS